jgi:hypothetical protein
MTLAEDLLGTWRLRSRVDHLTDGEVRPEPSLGPDPLGLLIYDRAGNFAAQFMRRDRSAVEPTDVASIAPPQSGRIASNNSTAVDGYDAYFGTYVVDEATSEVSQTLDAALTPSDVGGTVTREMHIVDEELVIRIALTTGEGVAVTRTLRWSREA